MERWLPLLNIFLTSPSPEGEASLWFQSDPNNSRSTAAFLVFILSDTVNQTSPPSTYFQTLPLIAQSRILSFLAAERHRFCQHQLRSLAVKVLRSVPSDFWVRRAAHNLLDVLTISCTNTTKTVFESIQEQQQQQQQQQGKNSDVCAIEEEFYALPDWLKKYTDAPNGKTLLPWLPISCGRFWKQNCNWNSNLYPKSSENMDFCGEHVESQPHYKSKSLFHRPLDASAVEKALVLKAELHDCSLVSKELVDGIKQLCLDFGEDNEMEILTMIEPWILDDELASFLLSQLCVNEGPSPAHVLCSVALPKLLFLQAPVSRTLLTAVLSICKQFPTAADVGLLIPLALHKEGINVAVCDFMAKIMKECLHQSHVSALFQKLLCVEPNSRRTVLLPCHLDLIGSEVVWTEPLFMLLQQVLNMYVSFTPDTVDRLVVMIEEVAGEFGRSLKFGNFILCFISKCPRVIDRHGTCLKRAAEKTDTFVTKAILSRLSNV